jgi:hypothetical protein|tara:strand:+ start:827 stop:1708 length:882 start_codon:yes stop_codon:yes gene_type:complete
MGLLDSLGTVFERVVPTAIGFARGGPAGAIAGLAGVERAKRAEKTLERAEFMYQQDPGMGRLGDGVAVPSYTGNRTSFFGNLGSSIGNFGRDVGGFVSDIAPALNLFGVGGGNQRSAPPAAQTIIRQRPDETAMSGELLGANLGMAPALFQGARSLLRTPGGQTALGFGAGAIGSALMGGEGSAPRITRRMKSDVRRIYMMAGMDPNATAQILNNLGTFPRMNFDASLVFFILTKRFRNDGPVVTKAAVRKTKTTLRRMKGVVDMYNSVCKPTATRRRAAPSRAKAVQLISNK